MTKFKLKLGVGRHYEGGVCYEAGSTVTTLRNLKKLFPTKFEEGVDVVETQLPPVPAAPAATETVGPPVDGDDVTAEFPEAKDAGLKVYSEKKGWFIVHDFDEAESRINEKSVRRKVVSDIIDTYLNGS
jgi:hypothetical protein